MEELLDSPENITDRAMALSNLEPTLIEAIASGDSAEMTKHDWDFI